MFLQKQMNQLNRFILFLLVSILFNFLYGCHSKSMCLEDTFWVATNGNDNANGSFNQPFLTLEKARDVLRTQSSYKMCPVFVNIKSGTYRLKSPFLLTPQDSGNAISPITYQAAPGAEVHIVGSEKLSDWTLHDGGLNIWKVQTHVTTNTMPRQLYVNGTRATRARTVDYPNYYTPTTQGYTYNYLIGTDPQIPPTWNNPSVVEAVTVTQWKMMRCPIAQVNGGNEVIMQNPCWKNVNVFPSPWNFHLLSWWENAYEFLDQPGEWYLDPNTKILYYIPRSGENLNTVDAELPLLEELVKGTGTVTNPISHINFKNLNFMYATWLQPNTSEGYALDQSGFHLVGFENPPNIIGHNLNNERTPGNISFNYAQDIKLANNTFSHMGAVALDFGTGSQKNQILNNHFSDISAAAIQLGGIAEEDHHPTVPSQLSKDNTIANNFIQYTGQEFYDAPGIYIGFTTRSLLEYNHIQHTSWTGIAIGWGWGLFDPGGFAGLPNAHPYEWGIYQTPSAAHQNKISHNTIEYFLEKLWDGGAIYSTGFQGTSREDGLFITNNIAQNKRPNAGGNTFYTDGGSRYVTLENNTSLNNPQGFFDFGPCLKASSFEALCLVTNIVPYGADMGGCIPYGDMLFQNNMLRDRFTFYNICENSFFPNYPINMIFINNSQISP